MATQSYANHRRWFPLHHFVLTPLLLANLIVAVRHWRAAGTSEALWGAITALGLLLLAGAARIQALRVQDRLIRLEVRLRAERLVPAAMVARFGELRRAQYVALRFAGDGEFAMLYERCLNGELPTGDAVKRAITDWQADELRV
jgi:hypothetical protein